MSRQSILTAATPEPGENGLTPLQRESFWIKLLENSKRRDFGGLKGSSPFFVPSVFSQYVPSVCPDTVIACSHRTLSLRVVNTICQ